MMGLFEHASSALRGRPRGASGSVDDMQDSEPDSTSILDQEEGSILSSLISQLRVGMDLHRVTFPTFVLEPRSMLERIADFLSHPELIFGAENFADPEERFLSVLAFYLSGWHVKPKGVKKPYNPVLGEFFRCTYEYPDGTKGFYIAEQISHHPPVSIFFYISPANRLQITGEIRPKSKFLGNSVCTIMEGEHRIFFRGKPEDGDYVVTMPNMYARGILFGKMVLELGDTCVVKNEQTGIFCDIEFKTKGFFSGVYNTVVGHVRRNSHEVGEVQGRWSHVIEFKPTKSGGEKRTLFDATSASAQKVAQKIVPPEEQQEANESRRLWCNLTAAILEGNMERAADAKNAVEEAQREERKRRDELGEVFVPRWFKRKEDGQWVPKIIIPDDAEQAAREVEEWLWPGSTSVSTSSSSPSTSTAVTQSEDA